MYIYLRRACYKFYLFKNWPINANAHYINPHSFRRRRGMRSMRRHVSSQVRDSKALQATDQSIFQSILCFVSLRLAMHSLGWLYSMCRSERLSLRCDFILQLFILYPLRFASWVFGAIIVNQHQFLLLLWFLAREILDLCLFTQFHRGFWRKKIICVSVLFFD